MQRVPKPGSLVRAFRSFWVPESPGASLLQVHKRDPDQEVHPNKDSGVGKVSYRVTSAKHFPENRLLNQNK